LAQDVNSPPQGTDNAAAAGRTEETLMTKADLIDEVSRLAELTRKDSEVIVETIFDSVVRSLRAGDKIEIRGFGSFRTRQRNPRVGRNPKTGERVEVPAKKIPFFKPSKELKDLVNEGDLTAVSTGEPTPAPPTPSAPPTAENTTRNLVKRAMPPEHVDQQH
jgi:integration host factor subunit beta